MRPGARLIRVKAFPDARRDEVTPAGTDRFEVRTREPAEAGRANAAVLRLLAERLGVEPKRLRLVKGAKERSKIVEVL